MTTTFYKGTTLDQSYLFKDKQTKLKRKLKFPKCFQQKIDISKANLKVIEHWIKRRTKEILDFEDDVLNGMIINMLSDPKADPKNIQIYVTGFLEKQSFVFMKELWTHLINCSKSEIGVSVELLKEEKRFLEEEKKAKQSSLSKTRVGGKRNFRPIERRSPRYKRKKSESAVRKKNVSSPREKDAVQ